MSGQTGRITLVATPIGNLGDVSPRAAEVLTDAEVWYVEDTRVSGKLQALLEIKRPMSVLNDHTPEGKVAEYAQAVSEGQIACLLSDAGTPVLSDPGTVLIDACYELGAEIDAVPGPSAVTTALALSGFFAQRYVFLGYLPRKAGPLKELLLPFAESAMTIVLFESPHRFGKVLDACSEVLGERRYAICRELTKVHQQVWRATLPVTPTESQVPHKGEVTLVIEGQRSPRNRSARV